MKVDIDYGPSSSVAHVSLSLNEKMLVESGAMIAMSPDMTMETHAEGGLIASLSRSIFGGESFFLNTYTGKKNGDRILLAPTLPGGIAVVEMQNESLLVQSGSFLASSEGIEMDTEWSGFKTLFSGYGLIMLRITGTGTLIISSCGSICPVTLGSGEKFIVDTKHLVTFEEQMGYEIKRIADWKSTILSGEGLVVELTGPGKVTLQSHSQETFLSRLIPLVTEDANLANPGG